jgi:hypothetical protein
MNIQVHSELSAHKFGGKVEDYFAIHKFIDSSKLFFFDIKHRSILHHTLGIDLCIRLFGDTITNSEGEVRLVRDIAAEHIKEDLNGKIPTVREWFEKNSSLFDPLAEVEKIKDPELKKFVLSPYLHSGIKSSFVITYSDFGVSLVEKFWGVEKALMLRKQMGDIYNIKSILKNFRFHSRWQYTPDLQQINLLK